MHINDWSSDVCSSDLSARDPPHRQPPGRGTIQGLSSVASGQGRFRAIWIRREVTIWPLAPEEIETLRLRLKVSRSEEHTSELQSLMRRSYAVFCLKKKVYHLQLAKQNKKLI